MIPPCQARSQRSGPGAMPGGLGSLTRGLRGLLALVLLSWGLPGLARAEGWSHDWRARTDRRIDELSTRPSGKLSPDEVQELVTLINQRAHWRNPGDHVVVRGGSALRYAGGGGVRRSARSSRSLASRSRRSPASSRNARSSSSSSRSSSSFGSSSFGSGSGSIFGSSGSSR